MDEIRDIYDTLLGQLTPEYAVPWVEELFPCGAACEELYGQMLQAYWRLCARLGVEEDPDGEMMIQSLLEIQWEIGRAMFLCGQEAARRQK